MHSSFPRGFCASFPRQSRLRQLMRYRNDSSSQGCSRSSWFRRLVSPFPSPKLIPQSHWKTQARLSSRQTTKTPSSARHCSECRSSDPIIASTREVPHSSSTPTLVLTIRFRAQPQAYFAPRNGSSSIFFKPSSVVCSKKALKRDTLARLPTSRAACSLVVQCSEWRNAEATPKSPSESISHLVSWWETNQLSVLSASWCLWGSRGDMSRIQSSLGTAQCWTASLTWEGSSRSLKGSSRQGWRSFSSSETTCTSQDCIATVAGYLIRVMLLKHCKETAGKLAWGHPQHPYHFAAPARIQGHSALALCYTDVSEPNKKVDLVGWTRVGSTIQSLSWESYDKRPMGLLCTGSAEGLVEIWDPAAIEGGKGEEGRGLLMREDVAEGQPVSSIEFNPLRKNLIAVGSTEVLIVDIKKGEMDVFNAGETNPHEGYLVSNVTWNKKIEKILASAGQNGQVVFWDVLANKHIFRLDAEECEAPRHVSLAWNPFIQTQIALAFDDDNKKEVQIWDLRNQRGPIMRVDNGQTLGITCLDWSPVDPNLLLASSRDSRIFCWNLASECEIVTQFPAGSVPLDIRWNRKVPSLFAASTENGISVYCLSQKDLHNNPPKWYIPTVGLASKSDCSHFSFAASKPGIHFSEYQPKRSGPLQLQVDRLAKIVAGQEVALEGDFFTALRLVDQPNQKVLDFLHFSIDSIIKEAENYTGKKHRGKKAESSKAPSTAAFSGFSALSDSEADNFFDSLGKKPEKEEMVPGSVQIQRTETIKRNKNWNSGRERLIKQNLLIGNFEGAVDVAMKCGRMAEGLVIAYLQGKTLFENTLKVFFTETTEPFIMDVLKNLMENKHDSLIEKYDPEGWRQCLAIILLEKSRESQFAAVTSLAKRLIKENRRESAFVCLALVQNYPLILSLIDEELATYEGPKRRLGVVIAAQKIAYLQQYGTKQLESRPQTESLLVRVALGLIDEGCPKQALHLLRAVQFKTRKYISLINRLTNSLGGKSDYPQEKQVQLTHMKKAQPAAPQKQAKQEPPKRQVFSQKQSASPLPPPPSPAPPSQPMYSHFNAPTIPPPPSTQKRPAPPQMNTGYQTQDTAVDQTPKRFVPRPPPPKINPAFKEENQSEDEKVVEHRKTVAPPPPPLPPSREKQIQQPIFPTKSKRSTPAPPPPPPPPYNPFDSGIPSKKSIQEAKQETAKVSKKPSIQLAKEAKKEESQYIPQPQVPTQTIPNQTAPSVRVAPPPPPPNPGVKKGPPPPPPPRRN